MAKSAGVKVSKNRWAAYATAGAATALAGTAQADIFYSGVLNSVFDDQNPSASVGVVRNFALSPGASFALDHNFRSAPTTGGFAGFLMSGPGTVLGKFAGVAGGSSGSFRYPSRLGPNQPIGGQMFISNFAGPNGKYFASMAVRGGFTNSQWLSPGTGFIAFEFDIGFGVQYGWARINMDSGPRRNSFTLIDYAWGSPGQAISTGQVPEPGSLGLLALGGAGLVAWRKRRASKLAAQA